MHTKLTKLLKIQYPILQGGMAWASDARLAAAVSNAGGAGIIANGGRTVEWVREQIRLAKTLTNKPFGVNLQLQSGDIQGMLTMVCEEKPAFVTLGAGNPVPLFEKLSKAGIIKIPVVPNARLAKRVEENGADAIVIEGMEAGGHIGQISTIALMTQIIPLIHIPVVAAGGFADGRGLASALVMGAAGIQVGTRFLVSEECPVHENMKRRLIEATDTDSVVTGLNIGSAVRGLRSAFTDRFIALERQAASREELEKMATGTNRLAAIDGDVEQGMVQAGQSLIPLTAIEPVQVIIDRIIAEARQALQVGQSFL